MQVKLLAFAQARDQLGFAEKLVECSEDQTPRTVLAQFAPGIDPKGMRVAVDEEYHDWDAPIGQATEIALIPPVSGG
jgi:molybdopterin synthase sulfur carrier subunit